MLAPRDNLWLSPDASRTAQLDPIVCLRYTNDPAHREGGAARGAPC